MKNTLSALCLLLFPIAAFATAPSLFSPSTLDVPLNWTGECNYTASDGDTGTVDIEGFSVKVAGDQITYGLYDMEFSNGFASYTLSGQGTFQNGTILGGGATGGAVIGSYSGTELTASGGSADGQFNFTLNASLQSPSTPGGRNLAALKLHADLGPSGWIDASCENLYPQP